MKISYPFKNSVEGTANTKLEILNEGDCMYAWNNKRGENRVPEERQLNQKVRVLTLIGILASSAGG